MNIGPVSCYVYSGPQQFHTKIVGVTKENDQGRDIQAILEEFSVFDVNNFNLRFVHEKDNSYDENAIKVFCDGTHVGYLSQDVAKRIVSVVDAGRIEGEVLQITGGNGKNYGCNIQITISDLDEEQVETDCLCSEEEPASLRLDKTALASLNDAAFFSYSNSYLAYAKSFQQTASALEFYPVAEQLRLISAELNRRERKSEKTNISNRETPAPIRTAEQMLDYCTKYNMGTGRFKGWDLKHLKLIEDAVGLDEAILTVFIGIHNYHFALGINNSSAYAITSKRFMIAQKKAVGQVLEAVPLDDVQFDFQQKTHLGIITVTLPSRAFKIAVSCASLTNIEYCINDSIRTAKAGPAVEGAGD